MTRKAPKVELPKNPELSFTITAGNLRRMLEVPVAVTSECKFDVHKARGGGWMQTCSVDLAHVCMFDIDIGPDTFSGSLKLSEKEMQLGINVDELHDFFKTKKIFPDGKALEFAVKDQMLYSKFRLEQTAMVHRFKLVDTAGLPDPKVPRLELPLVLHDFPLMELGRIIKLMNKTSDHMAFYAARRADGIYTAYVSSGSSNDEEDMKTVGEMETDFLLRTGSDVRKRLGESEEEHKARKKREAKSVKDAIEKSPRIKDITSSMFPIDYLSRFAKSVKKVADEVDVFIGDDFPTLMTWEGHGMTGEFLLAPRIENA